MSIPLGPGQPGRLFFDISELLAYVRRIDRYSGIQRVVAMLLSELAALADPATLYLCHVDPETGHHFAIRLDDLGTHALASPLAMRERFSTGRTVSRPIAALERDAGRPLQYHVNRARLEIAALLGLDGPFARYGATRDQWPELRRQRAPELPPVRKVAVPLAQVARPGDRLILLDSTWKPHHVAAFAKARERGLRITTLVHDLIPLVKPGTTADSMPLAFYRWLSAAMRYSESFIANSEATRRDLADFLVRHDVKTAISVLPLARTALPLAVAEDAPGADPEASGYAALAALDDRIRSLGNNPYALCVGTIEARKNIWRLAMAWKTLIDRGHTDLPRLVLAGRSGWHVKPLADLLAATGNIYGYVSIVEGPTDAELAYLYRNCLFTLMPSLYEGWGLPVGESLGYGKTAVVSNTSSLPEVGGDLVEYCDPHSVESIAAAVLRLVETPARREALEAAIASTPLRGWRQVAEDLLALITR